MEIAEICEILMIVAFGVSWPMNLIKSIKTKSTKGKSLAFLILIFSGYICGIAGKLISPTFKWYVMFFYVLNLCMVGMDLILYFINYNREKKQETK